VRVVLADDSVLFREGVARLLTEHDVEVAGQAGDGDALVALVAALHPDVVIVDVRMPPTFTVEGMTAAVRIRNEHPDTAVLVLSQYVETRQAVELLGRGARGVGYLLKDRVLDLGEFVGAVRRVGAGESVIDPDVVARLVGRSPEADRLARLTEREREVLALMAEGRSNAAIAEHLVIGQGAVEKHVANIFVKLGLPVSDSDNRRVLAVLRYLET
jgi:DNA-binding NarL/FixJ family response regulator